MEFEDARNKLAPIALRVVDGYLNDLVPTISEPPSEIEVLRKELTDYIGVTIECLMSERMNRGTIFTPKLVVALERGAREYNEEGKRDLAYHLTSLAGQLSFADGRVLRYKKWHKIWN